MTASSAKKAYAKALKDPRWAVKRLHILARDKLACTKCDAKKYLNVHHRYYLPGAKPWEYPDVALVTLCRGVPQGRACSRGREAGDAGTQRGCSRQGGYVVRRPRCEPRDGEPQPIGDVVPVVLRRIWERGRAHRAKTWTPEQIAHVERLLCDSLPPPKERP